MFDMIEMFACKYYDSVADSEKYIQITDKIFELIKKESGISEANEFCLEVTEAVLVETDKAFEAGFKMGAKLIFETMK